MERNFTFWLAALFLTSCASDPRYDLVIKDVGLFDGINDLGSVNIAVNADTIAAISKGKFLSDSVVDATGKYVVPGLINSHVHIWEKTQLRESYQAGIFGQHGNACEQLLQG